MSEVAINLSVIENASGAGINQAGVCMASIYKLELITKPPNVRPIGETSH